MSKEIIYGAQSRQAILSGINQLANAVSVTLGPKGRNVILGGKFGSPTITKDGDTILFGKYSGQEIKIDGQDYLIMREDDVLAITDSK